MTTRAVFLGVLAVFCLTGLAFAWLSSHNEAANTMRTPDVSVAVVESDDGVFYDGWIDPGTHWGMTVPKYVRFANPGDASVLIRVSFSESWSLTTTEGGETVVQPLSSIFQDELSNIPLATLGWTPYGLANADLWYDAGDGWFYYRKVLAPGESTRDVVESVTFVDSPPFGYEGADYRLRFTVEACQYSTALWNGNQAAAWATFKMTFSEDAGVLAWSPSAP